jgi:hypothetical protein
MFLRKLGSGVIRSFPCFGQVQGVVSPVALVRLTLQQTSPLELIDVAHHSAGKRSESPGKRALTHARGTGQYFDNACVRGSELEHSQPAVEARSRMRAELGKQGCRIRS